MSKHPIDHDRQRAGDKVAQQYSRIERQQGSGGENAKLQAISRSTREAEINSDAASKRLNAFLKIDRESSDS